MISDFVASEAHSEASPLSAVVFSNDYNNMFTNEMGLDACGNQQTQQQQRGDVWRLRLLCQVTEIIVATSSQRSESSCSEITRSALRRVSADT